MAAVCTLNWFLRNLTLFSSPFSIKATMNRRMFSIQTPSLVQTPTRTEFWWFDKRSFFQDSSTLLSISLFVFCFQRKRFYYRSLSDSSSISLLVFLQSGRLIRLVFMLNVWNSLHSSSLNNQPPACRSETLQASTRASVRRAPPGLTWPHLVWTRPAGAPGGSDQSPGPGAASSAGRRQNTEQMKQ